jgi:hypothetical protein
MSLTRTVVPGDWYGVLGESVIALLPPAAKARVAGLWETVDDGAGFDEVLDALISGGLRELPGFVLVSGRAGDVKVVIRGAGSAELDTSDGPVTVSGSSDTTWVEQNVSGVNGLRIEVAEPAGAAYTVESGLIRVASVEQPATVTAADAPDAEVLAVPIEPPVPSEPVPSEPVPSEPVPSVPPVSPPTEPERPRPILPPDPQLEREKREQAAAEAGEPVAPAPPAAPLPEEPAFVPGLSDDPPFDPLTSPELAVTPQDLGRTEDGPAVARLVFSSGQVVDVDQVIVVGRAPDARRVGDQHDVRLVTVPSPHQEISSTHLEVRPGADDGSAVVTDLGSTNGTVVVQPGLPAEDLRPGVPVQLLSGATIDLGEGVTVQFQGE